MARREISAPYLLFENFLESHVFKRGDLFIYKNKIKWEAINDWEGSTAKSHMAIAIDFTVAVKEDAAPRFKCDKPYPFGY